MNEAPLHAVNSGRMTILSKSYRSNNSYFFDGLNIYINGVINWRIWFYMGWSETKRRYRRTLIGPFWVTLSIAIFVGCIGIIFPRLWHIDPKTYLPFFASGYITWIFISSIITEACGTFVDSMWLIKQTTLSYAIYANNVVTRNVIVLFHHFLVYFIIMLCFAVPITSSTLLFLPGMMILCLTSSWFCILLGLFACRFRDIKQLVASLLQISMFVTPIFWSPAQLGASKVQLLVTINPLYHFIQIVRAPLLGQPPTLTDWGFAISICVVGWFMTLYLLGKYKKHLVFWL